MTIEHYPPVEPPITSEDDPRWAQEAAQAALDSARTFDKENQQLGVILGVLLHFGKADLSVSGTTELHWSAGAITISPAEADLLRARGMVR